MVVDKGKHYVYRHIRLDKNEPFYIGIGTNQIKTPRYYRANNFKGRNFIWKGIHKRTDIEVEILIESDDIDFIMKKEIEFITLYGMICNNTGTLSNLVNGNYGGYDKSEEAKKRNMDRYVASCLAMAKKNTGKNQYSVLSRGGFAYNLNGEFAFEFKSGIQAQNIIGGGAKSYNVIRKIDTDYSYYDYYYRSLKSDKIDTTNLNVCPIGKNYGPKRVAKINKYGQIEKVYETILSAATDNKIDKDAMRRRMNEGKPTRKAGLFKFVDANNNIIQ